MKKAWGRKLVKNGMGEVKKLIRGWGRWKEIKYEWSGSPSNLGSPLENFLLCSPLAAGAADAVLNSGWRRKPLILFICSD